MANRSYRLNLSEKELNNALAKDTVIVPLIDKNYPAYAALSWGEKDMLYHLIKATELMNDVFLEQDNAYNLDVQRELKWEAKSNPSAQKALCIFNALNGVAGLNGVDDKPVEIIKGISSLDGKNFYPEDLSKDEFHNILIRMLKAGKVRQVQEILSTRTMVRRRQDELIGIDYTVYFKKHFTLIAGELEKAAGFLEEDDAFGNYLRLQAKALLKNNPQFDADADKAWAKLQDTKFELTIGRENYDDMLSQTVFENPELKQLLEGCNITVNSKDTLMMRVGLVNKEGTDLIIKFKELMPKIAELMPYKEQYEQKISSLENFNQTMVDVDLLALSGDYIASRGGMTVAQNLPNGDKLAIKQGGGRRNVYHRQVRLSESPKRKQVLQTLLCAEDSKLVTPSGFHLFLIGHENGHTLGPNSDYQNSVGLYKNIIEETKSNCISTVSMKEYAKQGIISADELQQVYANIAFMGFLAAEPKLEQAHRIGNLIEFNYFSEAGAIYQDEAKKFHFDKEKFAKASESLLATVIDLQLSRSAKKAECFIKQYTTWGEKSQYISQVAREIGVTKYHLVQPKIRANYNTNYLSALINGQKEHE